MKRFNKELFFLISLMMAGIISAQEGKMEDSPEMKAWQEYMTPGWAHELMGKMVGEWNTENTFWQYPGAEAQTSTGTVKNEMLLGGRYLQSNHSGTAMGMPLEGISLTGYDNFTKTFINIWIDNMGTGVSKSEGTYDKKTKEITYKGDMIDPMTGKNLKYRAVSKIVDKDNQIFTMYFDDESGNEFKSMMITYKRK